MYKPLLLHKNPKLSDLRFEAALLDDAFAPDSKTRGLIRVMQPVISGWAGITREVANSRLHEHMKSADCPAIIFGKFRTLNDAGNYVTKAGDDLEHATLLVKDFDKFPVAAFNEFTRRLNMGLELLPYKFLFANSFSHMVHKKNDKDPEVRKGPLARFRMFIPPTRPLTYAEFEHISTIQTREIEGVLSDLLGMKIDIDPASNNPVQQYRTRFRKGALYSFESENDNLFDVDKFLAAHPLQAKKVRAARKVSGTGSSTVAVAVDSRMQFLIIGALKRIPAAQLDHETRFAILCALKGVSMEAEARQWYHKGQKYFDMQWKSIRQFDVPVSYIFTIARRFR
ncbi:hypothetical protein PQR67_23360 [Paraburkholderia fungorum]|uniref:hypothetical protein n=1 Tax=Paraburkholderia fungorum TaxID=134537 RepID=UPI0038BB59F7